MYPTIDAHARLTSAREDSQRRLATAHRARMLRLLARGDRVQRLEL